MWTVGLVAEYRTLPSGALLSTTWTGRPVTGPNPSGGLNFPSGWST